MKRSLSAIAAISLLASAGWGFSQEENKKEKQPTRDRRQPNVSRFFQRLDKNQDGFIELSEAPPQFRDRLKRYDTNKDGKISKQELQKARSRQGGGRGKPGEINTPPARGERHRDSLKVGDSAPDFTLKDPSGKRQVTLSSFQGKRPVVLIFGSYT